MTIDNTQIGAGEWVEVNGGGGSAEDVFVLSAVRNGKGDVKLTFNTNLSMNHTAGATITALGELGIDKAITLQGDPNDPAAVVVNEFLVLYDASGVVFNRLDFTNAHGVQLGVGDQNITIENSTLALLSIPNGTGSGEANDSVTGNTFTGSVIVNGDGNGLSADHVIDNAFTASATLYMINNGDAVVSGNRFNVSANQANFDAITIVNCPSILLYNNSVTINNADGTSVALLLWDSSFYPQSLSAFVENNVFDTGGKGVGMETAGAVSAMVEFNDFRANAEGVYLYGDGRAVGTVDLGGGTLGSQGQNNFSSFTAAGAAQGYFAISMHNTANSDQVFAYDNIWSEQVPYNLVKDSLNNSNTPDAVFSGGSTGTGELLLINFGM